MKIIKCDLLTKKIGIIAHGVNCQGVMGSGVAKQIRDEYPIVYKKYVEYVKYNKSLLGTVFYVLIDNNLIVANCFTQEYYGRNGFVYANIHAVEKCFDQLLTIKDKDIYLPKIGCGLGGLSWDYDVYPLLNSKFNTERVFICTV